MFDFNGLQISVTQSRNTAYLLNGVLALLIILSATHWVRLYMDRDHRLLPGSSLMPAPAPTGVGINTDELISYHLFGVAPASAPASSDNIPLSSLNLKLTGVVASDRGGFALISVNGQPQSAFFIGEVVTRNAVLDQVLPDRVVLLRGGSREALLLDDNEQNNSPENQLRIPDKVSNLRTNPADFVQVQLNHGGDKEILNHKLE